MLYRMYVLYCKGSLRMFEGWVNPTPVTLAVFRMQGARSYFEAQSFCHKSKEHT